MAMVVIYFNDGIGKVQYSFYHLVDLTLSLPLTRKCINISTVYNDTLVAKGLKGTNAEYIFAAIKTCLEEDKIPIVNVMALRTDGANVMIGARNSVPSRFRDAQPNIFHIHYTCHVAALCKTFPKCVEQVCRDIQSFLA